MAKQTLSYRYYYLSPPNPAWKENYSWQLTNRNAKPGAGFEEPARGGSFGPVLVKWADVLVTNFLPRVRQRLRLNYEDVASLNPRLIYADITRYGELGPKADKPGFDHTAYWARSGLMQFTRDASSPPALPVSGIGDHATSISLFCWYREWALPAGAHRQRLQCPNLLDSQWHLGHRHVRAGGAAGRKVHRPNRPASPAKRTLGVTEPKTIAG